MSHAIDMTGNRANMAYIGATPWHGLGQELTKGAPIEVWQREAGMAWNIERAAVQFVSDANTCVPAVYPDTSVLYRSDDHAPLSIVSSRYKIVQPREVLEFYRELVANAGFELETAGCLNEGRKFWALARTGDNAFVGPRDELKAYLLLASSCDGTLATLAQFTSVRVVCQNTLAMSMDKGNNTGRVKTSHRTTFNANQVKAQLGLYSESWAAFVDQAKQLADFRLTSNAQIKHFLCSVFDGDETKKFADQPKGAAMEAAYASIVQSPGSDLPSAVNSAWGLVNGITHYVDFQKRARSSNNRLDSAWFGSGADLKDKALSAALELVAA